ncbi:S1 RNA-binding domain-containing protein [Nocardia sp. NPDC127526]|uniref:S1 RNA-binding domain-containing protein n=1 Tax=Nocardia sp. NPDC127526 TaxID=3345393 RepID=UPI00362B4121
MSPSENPETAWPAFVAAHEVGSTVEAAVVSIVPFGAFLEVAPGVHGLLHRNEWREWSAAPEVGATLTVRVLNIDNEKHRVALGEVR